MSHIENNNATAVNGNGWYIELWRDPSNIAKITKFSYGGISSDIANMLKNLWIYGHDIRDLGIIGAVEDTIKAGQ